MRFFARVLILVSACSSIDALAGAQTAVITQRDGWIRETPPNMQNAAAFVSLHNSGADAKKIIAIQCADLAARCEIHEHLHTPDGKMRMQKVEAPLAIAGNSTLTLAPGGYHIMLFEIRAPLRAGTTAKFTIIFDDQSTLPVQLPIKAIRAE